MHVLWVQEGAAGAIQHIPRGHVCRRIHKVNGQYFASWEGGHRVDQMVPRKRFAEKVRTPVAQIQGSEQTQKHLLIMGRHNLSFTGSNGRPVS